MFDAVLRDNLEAILDAVPLTAEDLPGYAARLYDSFVEHPKFLRLATWDRLEKVPRGELFGGHDPNKLEAIAGAQRDGRVKPSLAPSEVISLVTAIAMTWSPVNVTYAASVEDEESEHARRRSVISEAVSGALAPGDRAEQPG